MRRNLISLFSATFFLAAAGTAMAAEPQPTYEVNPEIVRVEAMVAAGEYTVDLSAEANVQRDATRVAVNEARLASKGELTAVKAERAEFQTRAIAAGKIK